MGLFFRFAQRFSVCGLLLAAAEKSILTCYYGFSSYILYHYTGMIFVGLRLLCFWGDIKFSGLFKDEPHEGFVWGFSIAANVCIRMYMKKQNSF